VRKAQLGTIAHTIPLVLMESTRLETTPKADARDVLAAAIKNKRAILFVGAGISMSVGLPSWQLLVDHLIEELELDGETLKGMQFNHQMLAEYYRLKKGGIGPLRSWLDRNWKVGQDRVSKSRLHQLIVELSFPVIYTTNYDRNLETAFEVYGKPYSKISNAKSIASAIEGTTQIVKYHGDFDDDSSLVLAETDFFNRLSFDTALDIKFRADALGRTILFIGYSMSDPNIRLLLHRIWQLWEQSGYAEHRPQSFIFMSEKNVVQMVILARWGITVLNPTSADECESELVAFLSDIQARSLRDY
jgi:hypothetical protein